MQVIALASTAAAYIPEPVQPALLLFASDIHDVLLLQPSLATLGRLAVSHISRG